MTNIHRDSQLPPADRDMPGHFCAALNRLIHLISAWRVQRRTKGELRARSDFVPADIRRSRTKIDLELLRLEWF